VETRLLMRHPDGTWAGYTYEWDDAQTDATLLPASKTKLVNGQTWYFPGRTECLQCHTAAAGFALGPEVGQLNGELAYPGGRTANQLATLAHLGLVSVPLAGGPAALPRYPASKDPEPLEARAKAYLHANCSGCHRPGGTGRGPADFRYATPLAEMGVCDVAPQQGDLGILDARLLAPGDPLRSLLSVRLHALGTARMPPLGSGVVDLEGTGLVDAWIASLSRCP
jgi:mono/diheme cytochrome c family protein